MWSTFTLRSLHLQSYSEGIITLCEASTNFSFECFCSKTFPESEIKLCWNRFQVLSNQYCEYLSWIPVRHAHLFFFFFGIWCDRPLLGIMPDLLSTRLRSLWHLHYSMHTRSSSEFLGVHSFPLLPVDNSLRTCSVVFITGAKSDKVDYICFSVEVIIIKMNHWDLSDLNGLSFMR